MKKSAQPEIAITMGDPCGIGPEVALKAVAHAGIRRLCRPVLVGDTAHLGSLARGLGLKLAPAGTRLVDTGGIRRRVRPGRPSKQCGLAAGSAIEKAVELALSGEVAGVVTAPVSKQSLAMAGYGMIGHTELLAGLTRTRDYAMMLTRKELRVVFATTHVPISRVARSLSKKALVRKFEIAAEYLHLYMGISRPRLGVCCLNPHCGEGGVLSREEQQIIIPAIRAGIRRGISVDGPYPADSIFGEESAPGFDATVAMYHDQGMIPLKMVRREEVVNITLGIPVIRTSPGHGTAFDIAGRGVADARGMVAAVRECAAIAERTGHAGRVS